MAEHLDPCGDAAVKGGSAAMAEVRATHSPRSTRRYDPHLFPIYAAVPFFPFLPQTYPTKHEKEPKTHH